MPGSARAPDLMVDEPRGRYARRAPVVVDASVIAAALFDEPTRVEASEALEGTEAHAPDLLDHELKSSPRVWEPLRESRWKCSLPSRSPQKLAAAARRLLQDD